MATQRISTKVKRIIQVTPEEVERILLKHYTNGIGDVTFDISSGGFFKQAVIVSEIEEYNKSEEI